MSKIDLLKEQSSFLTSLENKGKSFNTLKNYKTDLNIFNKYLIAKGRELILDGLTTTEVSEYANFLEKQYSSPNSIRRRIQALRIFFDFLIEHNIYDQNPVKKMPTHPKVVDLPRPAPFHKIIELQKHLQSQMESTQGHEQLIYVRNIVLLCLIYDCGLKVSEIEKLSLAHILNKKDDYRILIAPDKREPYTIPMNEYSKIYIKKYSQLLSDQKSYQNIEFQNFLFNANPFKILSGGLSARGIEIIFKEFSKKLEINMTAKNIRQACIFKWLSKDIQQSRIKEWMGVQPQYSLKPYIQLLKEKPETYTYKDFDYDAI